MTSDEDGAKAVGTPFTQWAISPNCTDAAAADVSHMQKAIGSASAKSNFNALERKGF